MATAKEFIARVGEIDGVAGCLLVRSDGQLLGQAVADPELYTSLLQISGSRAAGVKESVGFSYCRHVGFSREDKENFYVFPIDTFLLGVLQEPDCYVPDMLESIYRLIGRVSTSRTSVARKEDD